MKDLLIFFDSILIAKLRVTGFPSSGTDNLSIDETYFLDDRQPTLPGIDDQTTETRIAIANEFMKLPFSLGEIIEFCTENNCQLFIEDGANSAPTQVLVGDPTEFTTESPLPGGQEGVAYDEEIEFVTTTGDGSIKLVSGSLPTGTSLVGESIQGTPTTAGTYVFVLRLQDSNYPSLTQDKEYSITIIPA
jgi:hypothetical protein